MIVGLACSVQQTFSVRVLDAKGTGMGLFCIVFRGKV